MSDEAGATAGAATSHSVPSRYAAAACLSLGVRQMAEDIGDLRGAQRNLEQASALYDEAALLATSSSAAATSGNQTGGQANAAGGSGSDSIALV